MLYYPIKILYKFYQLINLSNPLNSLGLKFTFQTIIILHLLFRQLLTAKHILVLLIAIPLCVIILLSNRGLLAKYLGIKRYIPIKFTLSMCQEM